MRTGRATFHGWLTILVAASSLLATAAVGAAATIPLQVVTSIPPLAMLAAELGGDRVLAHSILPPGADPHTFEPRPSHAIAIAEADVIVVLGSSIDDWIGNTIMTPSGAAPIVRLDRPSGRESERESGQESDDDHHHAHEEEGAHSGHRHDGDHQDPHVWLDPAWVRVTAVPALHRAFAEADPEGAARYGVSARAMAEKLSNLEDDIRESFAGAATNSFLAWHPAWEHFAKRFGLHSVGSVGESSGREPSVHAMIAAIRAARAAGVRAVLVEPQVDPRQAKVLAGELDVPLVTVDPLGDAWSLDRATYQTLMLFNAKAFAKAIGVVREEDKEETPPLSGGPASPSAP